jgi:type 1 glutamine amidotransferase
MPHRFLVPLLTAVSLVLSAGTAASAATAPRKIVLIAGKKSHGPGAHEYVKSVKLLKVMLDRSNAARGIRTEIHFNGWPEDPTTLDTADTIMTVSDGQDGDKYSPVPFLTPERMAILEKQMQRGCGFVTFHFSTFTPDRYGEQILEWGGGYFDWQDDAGNRNWYSAIKTLDTRVDVAAPQHPITRGVTSFDFKEEFYYNIRFRPDDPRLTPILRVPALHAEVLPSTVAWAVQRAKGRGFGTTTGHFFDNWKNPNYRKLILNAILWTANAEVPAGGVEAPFVEDSEVDRALVPKPIRTLLLTGDQHPGHKWKETTPALIEALHNRGPEFAVTISENPDTALAAPSLQTYQLVLLNYCNWTTPGLSEAAKANFIRYLQNGGGLAIIHFANGAFHGSLPQAPPSDWPEYRKIVARVWNGAKDKSGHDRYGPLRVRIIDQKHPVTKGMPDFDAVDELYFRQEGDVPVTVLATAHSRITGDDEPMAMVYRYGKARVFQTVLGHSKESINSWGETQLIRRGCAWAAATAPR